VYQPERELSERHEEAVSHALRVRPARGQDPVLEVYRPRIVPRSHD
jgi:hypothetical protein